MSYAKEKKLHSIKNLIFMPKNPEKNEDNLILICRELGTDNLFITRGFYRENIEPTFIACFSKTEIKLEKVLAWAFTTNELEKELIKKKRINERNMKKHKRKVEEQIRQAIRDIDEPTFFRDY